jgi:hypothetical protein
VIVADLLGFLGRGHFAKARVETSDGSIVRYERIERSATPSILSIRFGEDAIRDGKIRLWAGESLLKGLGTQRIIPQPESSVIGEGGVFYTFAATTVPATAEFQLRECTICNYRLPSQNQLR